MTRQFAGGRPAEVLLVEDNDNDFELAKIGFTLAKFPVNLHHAANGDECMDFLRKVGKHAHAPTPDIILLDLNMPRMDGREVLKAISRDERLSHLPIVVLTTSDAHDDVLKAYQLGCSSYIVKPIDFKQFSIVIQGIVDYWFTLVTLPTEPESL